MGVHYDLYGIQHDNLAKISSSQQRARIGPSTGNILFLLSETQYRKRWLVVLTVKIVPVKRSGSPTILFHYSNKDRFSGSSESKYWSKEIVDNSTIPDVINELE